MTQEEYKEYRSHLDAIRKLAEKNEFLFFYADSVGNTLLSHEVAALETLLLGNMFRQDGFRAAVFRCVENYSVLKDKMLGQIRAIREEDSRNIADKLVSDLLKENRFKQSENKQ